MDIKESRIIVATVEHTCKLCGEKITVGEKYEQQLYHRKGEKCTCNCHRECAEIAFDCDIECFDFVDQKQFSSLLKQYREVNGPYNSITKN